jgi:crossover junction endodeoxyribonuclease RuvC
MMGWCSAAEAGGAPGTEMIVLGIDPGYAILGYGVLEVLNGKMKAIDCGVIETTPQMTFPERLERLYTGTLALIEKFQPDHIAFEELFFYRNTTTALAVAAARGVAILASQQAGRPLFEYTPMQIKLSVTGDGHADKQQMQSMVKLLLRLSKIPKPDDAADALGVALCHANALGPAVSEFLIK